MGTRVASSPQELVGRPLSPRYHGKIFQPLLDGNSQDVGVKGSLAQTEDGLEVAIDVGLSARRNTMESEVIGMSAEVGLSFDVGDKVLARRFEIVVVLVHVPGIRDVRASHGPAFGRGIQLFIGIVVCDKYWSVKVDWMIHSYLHSRSSTRI